jgi:hypothetical protein
MTSISWALWCPCGWHESHRNGAFEKGATGSCPKCGRTYEGLGPVSDDLQQCVRWSDATGKDQAVKHPAMNASAPQGMSCIDCIAAQDPCPNCYSSWWRAKHPHITCMRPDNSVLPMVTIPLTAISVSVSGKEEHYLRLSEVTEVLRAAGVHYKYPPSSKTPDPVQQVTFWPRSGS